MPTLRLEGDPFFVQVGERVVSLNCRRSYAGWSDFSSKIAELATVLRETALLSSPERFSLKYIDLVELDAPPSLSYLEVSTLVGGRDLGERPVHIRTEIKEEGFVHVLQIASPAEVRLSEGNAPGGARRHRYDPQGGHRGFLDDACGLRWTDCARCGPMISRNDRTGASCRCRAPTRFSAVAAIGASRWTASITSASLRLSRLGGARRAAIVLPTPSRRCLWMASCRPICCTDSRSGVSTSRPRAGPGRDGRLRLGAALRRAESSGEPGAGAGAGQGERARPRAHMRRAHWHTFRIGEGRRGYKVKWMAPTPVNVRDPDALPATVRPVF